MCYTTDALRHNLCFSLRRLYDDKSDIDKLDRPFFCISISTNCLPFLFFSSQLQWYHRTLYTYVQCMPGIEKNGVFIINGLIGGRIKYVICIFLGNLFHFPKDSFLFWKRALWVWEVNLKQELVVAFQIYSLAFLIGFVGLWKVNGVANKEWKSNKWLCRIKKWLELEIARSV